jgi:hypothetical protein
MVQVMECLPSKYETLSSNRGGEEEMEALDRERRPAESMGPRAAAQLLLKIGVHHVLRISMKGVRTSGSEQTWS